MKISPSFTKMAGTGNSFLIANSITSQSRANLTSHFQMPRSKMAQRLCSNEWGAGTDGLIFIEEAKSEAAAFSWDFYNADGSKAEMCGNAARCVAKYFLAYVDTQRTSFNFESGAGLIQARFVDDDNVRITMSQVHTKPIQTYSTDLFRRDFQWIDTGVPHLVAELKDIDINALKSEARAFRHHKNLGSAGANVTYFCREEEGRIRAYSYERGVEDFTLSCGTGAVAAAYVSSQQMIPAKGIEVLVRGGALQVGYDSQVDRATLTGEAHFISEMQFY